MGSYLALAMHGGPFDGETLDVSNNPHTCGVGFYDYATWDFTDPKGRKATYMSREKYKFEETDEETLAAFDEDGDEVLQMDLHHFCDIWDDRVFQNKIAEEMGYIKIALCGIICINMCLATMLIMLVLRR